MKKVIVISTSLRPGSNSHALAEQFAKGAEAAGHNPGGGGGVTEVVVAEGKTNTKWHKRACVFSRKNLKYIHHIDFFLYICALNIILQI